jgi:hypothetical protein
MTQSQPPEKETWRLLLFRRGGLELLLPLCITHSCRVPEFSIPRWQRTAPHLNALIRQTLGIETVSMYELPPSGIDPEDYHYHVAEVIGEQDSTPAGFAWVPTPALIDDMFSEPSDYHSVRRALNRDWLVTTSRDCAPFANFGWFADLIRWVQDVLRPHGLRLNNRFLQLNASPDFALLKFEAGCRDAWFKAAGLANSNEFRITATLTNRFPEFLPEYLATHDAWNGWLMLNAEGETLFESPNAGDWQRVGISLAKLQIESVSQTGELLAAGARDLRLRNLQRQCNSFFRIIHRVMQLQVKSSPPPLAESALCQLQQDLKDILLQFGEINIPDTLGHLDFNPGNIIISPARCTFLDWAEATVGNPTITFQYLLEYFRRTFGADSAAERLLTASYVKTWETIRRPFEIGQAIKIASVVAAFASATSFVARRNIEQIETSPAAGWLRGLTRRIHREVAVLRSLGIAG